MRRSDSEPLIPADATAVAAEKSPQRSTSLRSDTLSDIVFPGWARLAPGGAQFSAGVGLALVDQVLRNAPPFADAFRQRLALRAAAASAAALRLREDEAALRDAEHLASGAGETSPAGRVHRLWRDFAGRPATLEAAALAAAAARVDLPPDLEWAALAGALKDALASRAQPLAAAATAGLVLARELPTTRRPEAEILAWWAADVTLAERLGWERPVALAATTLLRPELRGASNRRPRPSDPEWPDALAGAVALAARDASALAAELARGGDRLLAVAPKLRAKGAARVVELLLADDAVSPARAARSARLSDRAARRLFDRLVELDAVRELTGRPNFRLYGL
jgi:hypothetical protein